MNPVFEVVGYVASGFIVLSILQRSILRLRLVGLAGSFSFIAYGLLIDAFPVVLVNTLTAGIHLWFLRKLLLRQGDVFEILHVAPESQYLQAFLAHHADDIARHQPEFSHDRRAHDLTAFVLRDLVPAGLLIGTRREGGSVDLALDYAIPAYRDFRMGTWVFSGESGLFPDRVGHVVRAMATTTPYAAYLRRMGFTEVESGRFELVVRAAP